MTIDGKKYFMQVNEWGSSAAETMSFGGAYFFKMTTQQASSAGSPVGFPSMFIGANSGNSASDGVMPIQVSSITSVLTTWNWADNGTLSDTTNNSYSALFDVWFSTSPTGDGSATTPSGGELMIWLYLPADKSPIGVTTATGVTIAGMPGTWDIWTGSTSGKPVISYVRVGGTQAMSFDLNVFIKDAVCNHPNTIQASVYLTSIITGFQIWRGGVNLESTRLLRRSQVDQRWQQLWSVFPEPIESTRILFWLSLCHFYGILRTMKAAMNAAGRVVIPKALRSALGAGSI